MTLYISSRELEKEDRLRRIIASKFTQIILPPITKIELVLTERCTLHCDYCFVANKNASKRMSLEIAHASINFLMAHSHDKRELSVAFFGGEPLLEFALMCQIATYAKEMAKRYGKQISFAVTTNNTRMTHEIARFGRKYDFNYLLSVDGDQESHDRHRVTAKGVGSWKSVMGTKFDILKSIQGWVGARLTVNPDTVDRLSSGVRLLHERGVNQFLIGLNMDVEWNENESNIWVEEMEKVRHYYFDQKLKGSPIRINEFDETLADIRNNSTGKWGCDAGRTRLAVSCSGDLYPCSRFVSPFPGVEDRYRLGNVFEGITNFTVHAELLDATDQNRPICRSCEYKDYCTGPCAASSFHMLGDIHAPQPINCVYSRLRVTRLEKPL